MVRGMASMYRTYVRHSQGGERFAGRKLPRGTIMSQALSTMRATLGPPYTHQLNRQNRPSDKGACRMEEKSPSKRAAEEGIPKDAVNLLEQVAGTVAAGQTFGGEIGVEFRQALDDLADRMENAVRL